MAEYCQPDISIARIVSRLSDLATRAEAAEIVPDDLSESEELIATDLHGYLQLLIKQETDYLLGLMLPAR